MESSLHKLHRIRRRRLIVAFVFMFGAGLWWSMRPKVDPRLVGTWIEDGSAGFCGLKFHPDGRQQECERVTDGRPVWTSWWTWSVSGKVMRQQVNMRGRNVFDRLRALARDQWERLRGVGWCYEIVELSDSSLKIRPIPIPGYFTDGEAVECYRRVTDESDDIWKRQFAFPSNL